MLDRLDSFLRNMDPRYYVVVGILFLFSLASESYSLPVFVEYGLNAFFAAALVLSLAVGAHRGVKSLKRAKENSVVRTRLRRGSGMLLIVLGSGTATMGFVESDGFLAGIGVMLIVSGAS